MPCTSAVAAISASRRPSDPARAAARIVAPTSVSIEQHPVGEGRQNPVVQPTRATPSLRRIAPLDLQHAKFQFENGDR